MNAMLGIISLSSVKIRILTEQKAKSILKPKRKPS